MVNASLIPVYWRYIVCHEILVAIFVFNLLLLVLTVISRILRKESIKDKELILTSIIICIVLVILKIQKSIEFFRYPKIAEVIMIVTLLLILIAIYKLEKLLKKEIFYL